MQNTDEIISKPDLIERLNSIKEFLPEREFQYYHIRSIDNFIFHIGNFKSHRTSERMARQIQEYLSLLIQKISEPHDKHDLAKELFPHIWKIADTYRYELGFRKKTPFWMIIGIWTIVFLILRIIGPTWFALLMAPIGLIVHSFLMYVKIKSRKTF